MTRRDLLIRTGLLIGAEALVMAAGQIPLHAAPSSSRLDTWEGVRRQFPLAPDLIHMACFFLASHPTPVQQAIERHRRELDADPIGYWFANHEHLEAQVLTAAAEYVGVTATDIALTDSTTMGLGLLYGGLRIGPGQEILTTVHDHYSTDVSIRLRAERTGAAVRQIALYRDLVTVTAEEIVDNVRRAIRPATRIVAVTWVHSSTGLKLPIQGISAAIAESNASRDDQDRILLCVDGVHGIGVEDVDLPALGCDFFVAGAHKWLFGPRGTGFVWGRPSAWPTAHPTIPTFNETAYDIWMHEIPPQPVPMAALMTPGGFHSFEHRWALNEAFAFHLRIGKSRVQERIHALNAHLKEALSRMPHVRLHTPRSPRLSAGIVCFEVDGWKPEDAVTHLRRERIVASVTPYATRYVRLAPSLLTSDAEVETTIEVLARMR